VGGCEERREGGRTASRSGTSGAPGRCRTSCAPQARGVPGPDEDCRSKNGDNSRGGGGVSGRKVEGIWGTKRSKGGGGGRRRISFSLSSLFHPSFFLFLVGKGLLTAGRAAYASRLWTYGALLELRWWSFPWGSAGGDGGTGLPIPTSSVITVGVRAITNLIAGELEYRRRSEPKIFSGSTPIGPIIGLLLITDADDSISHTMSRE